MKVHPSSLIPLFFDDDSRQGVIAGGHIIIGTLGCFVRLANGAIALLSNNHVVAGENRGVRGTDRILQPGSGVHTVADQIAVLSDFKDILTSPSGATPGAGTAILNDIDAGIAKLDDGISWKQAYLPVRSPLVAPSGTATAKLGDQVFKVGRTTGLTFGEVIDVSVTVGPVGYSHGPRWFRRSITIKGVNGTQFSDRGDSGSTIVHTNGEVLGVLYAGNGQQTYACPLDLVFNAFTCTLV